MIENKIFKKKIFPPLVKAKNQHQNFENTSNQKWCAIRRLNVSNFCYFKKKIRLTWWKRKKLLEMRNFQHKLNNQRFWTVFYQVNLFFFKNNKSLEHLNVLLRIFFVSGVFQNFEVDFWPLLNAPKQFWREKIFLQNFLFFNPYESINFFQQYYWK